MQRAIDLGIPGLEVEIVANPVELRGAHGVDQMLGSASVQLVITERYVERRKGIEKIHGIDHLQPVPELAFERRIQEIAAVKDAHFGALRLQFANHGYDATEAAAGAVFDVTDAVRVIEVDKAQPVCCGCSRLW